MIERNDMAATELSENEDRALAALCEELGAEAPPELDWSEMEARLFQRITREPVALPRTRVEASAPGGVFAQLATFAAAAAALTLLLLGTPSRNDGQRAAAAEMAADGRRMDTESLAWVRPDRVTADDPERARNVAAVESQSWLETGEESVELALPGVAHWRVAPHSKIWLDGGSQPYRLRLERGEVHVRVVPRHDPSQLSEALIVQAGGTQVAVHGTVFRVMREQDAVQVEVQRGVVTVGPTGYRGATTGRLLAAPVRARFSLDGGRRARILQPAEKAERGSTEAQPPTPSGQRTSHGINPIGKTNANFGQSQGGALPPVGKPTTGASEPNALGHKQAAGKSAPATQANDDSVPSTPSPKAAPTKPVLLSQKALQSLLLGCIRQSALKKNGDAQLVAVHSTVTVQLGADGFARSIRFSPPLEAGTQQRCSGLAFGSPIEGEGRLRFGIHIEARSRPSP